MDTVTVIEKKTSSGYGFDGSHQVVLFNDDHNSCEYVIACLMSVFGHSVEMATKLMLEAHRKGKTIAQVERREDAMRHVSQLIAFGLNAIVELI